MKAQHRAASGWLLFLGCTVLLSVASAARAGQTVATSEARAAADLAFKQVGPGALELTYGGQRLLLYAFASNQFKPYVKELYTLRGDNVLLDAPPDHLHHHGLMYAVHVNGVNFWEERDQAGFEKPIGWPKTELGHSRSGLPQASLRQTIHWLSHELGQLHNSADAALLVETRTITVTVNPPTEEVALTWRAEFQVPAGKRATLGGASYNGLGLRLPPAFNLVAEHENSENAPYPTQGKGDVTPAKWSAVSHSLRGNPVTVALFGRADEAGKGPLFFTMVQPFTYLAVTQGLDKAPLTYSSGDRFSLEYLLVVFPERKSPTYLQERYGRWARQSSTH